MAFDEGTRIPSLQLRGAYNQSIERAGEWTERTLTADLGFTPPFTVRFAALTVDGLGISGQRSTPTANGIVEIDWIELVRAPVSLGPQRVRAVALSCHSRPESSILARSG